MDLQQWDKAELTLKKTIELDPKAVNAYFALGEVYRREKKYGQAEKTLQDGLAIETHSAQAHLTLARVYWVKGDKTKAIETQTKAVAVADERGKEQLQQTLDEYKSSK